MSRDSAAAAAAGVGAIPETSFSDVHRVLLQLSHFPMNQLFRFVVDGALQKREGGYDVYESREVGCISAVITAMAETFKYLDKPIDVDLIKELHRLCGQGVALTGHDPDLGVFGNTHVVQRLMLESTTKWALNQFLIFPPKDRRPQGTIQIIEVDDAEKIGRTVIESLNYYTCLNQDIRRTVADIFRAQEVDATRKNLWFLYHPPGSTCESGYAGLEALMKKGCEQGVACDNPEMPNEMPHNMSTEALVAFILKEYQGEQDSKMDSSSQGDNVLYTTQELTRTHPFMDLVTRTFVGCVFFLMQIKNGDLPAILEEPKMFPFTDIKVLSERVAQGRAATQALIDNPSAEIYGMTVATDATVDPRFKEATNKFKIALAQALYEAGKSYLKPGSYYLALQCYERAYHLFASSGSSSLKNHVAYLYGIGLCQGRLKQHDSLAESISRLEALKGQPRRSSDLFDYDAYIEGSVAKLQKLMPQPSASAATIN